MAATKRKAATAVRKAGVTVAKAREKIDRVADLQEHAADLQQQIGTLVERAEDGGRRAVQDLEHAISARPFVALLASFSLGMLVSRLIDRS